MAEVMLTFGAKATGVPREVFVQWKNIQMCADFTCACGTTGHIDDSYFGRWTCPECEQSWSMNWVLDAYPVASEDSDEPMDVDPSDDDLPSD